MVISAISASGKKTSASIRRTMLIGEGGGALIETALVIPVFMLLVFGLMNYAMIMFGICNISYASHSAVRYACLHSATSNVPTTQATINNLIAPYIYAYPGNTWSSSIAYTGTGNQIGNTAKVSITITYNIAMPFSKNFGINLSTAASGIITQ